MKNIKKLIRLALCACGISGLMNFPAQAQTDIHVLDVGQGLSVLVESQGHYLLYDGGDRSASSFVVSYLKQEGVQTLDYVIASHYDSDHLNGVVGSLNVFPSAQIYAPNYQTDTKVFQSFENVVASKGIPKSQPAVGTVFELGDADIQVLSPSGSGYSDVNNYSIAIRVQDGNKSFLITGDAEAESEAQICATGLNLDSDVYVVGHHGSGTSTSWDLLQKATPEYAIISCGAGNSYGHPHIETMEKLQAMEIDVYRTDKQGTVIASTDGNSLTWNAEPCNDYTPGDENDKPAQPQKSAGGENQASTNQPQTAATTVYWTPGGKSYHNSRNCSTLKRSKTIMEGNLSDALTAGKNDPCNVCVK